MQQLSILSKPNQLECIKGRFYVQPSQEILELHWQKLVEKEVDKMYIESTKIEHLINEID